MMNEERHWIKLNYTPSYEKKPVVNGKNMDCFQDRNLGGRVPTLGLMQLS